MHAAAWLPVKGLWHKGSMQAVALGNGFDHCFKGHNIVCRLQGAAVFKVDLVLSPGRFMMGAFDFKAHFLQCQDNLPPCIFAPVKGGQVKIAGAVNRLSGRLSVFTQAEQKKFAFCAHVKAIAQLLGFFHLLLQYITAVALKIRTVRIFHITENSGDLSLLRPPGQNLKRRQVRMQDQVRMIRVQIARHRIGVKGHTIEDGTLDLLVGYGNIFTLSINITELHPDKFNIIFLDIADRIECFFAKIHFLSP